MQERRTAAIAAERLRDAGFEVTTEVGQTGVVGLLRNGDGPVVMLRADMDALPVKEQTGLPFASKATGTLPDGTETPVMHACGHDTHITTWLATARRLAAMKDQWSGTVVMILQPGEERVIGAQAMLDDGLFTRFPKPDYLLAFHDSASLPAGQIGVTRGFALANVDTVNIDVKGVGGHGAYPQNTKDPIVLASRIVMALQTLVSRENDPQQPAVVTVGSFHAGTKSNIIGDDAKLALTVRSYTPETRKLLLDGIRRIVRGEAIAAGMPEDRMPTVEIEQPSADATFNTAD
jgi:hippurate hydrolase